MIPAQELVERALASADALGADGCMVLVEESSHVDVRYRAEHDDDQRRPTRALGQRHRTRRRVLRLGPAHRGGRRRRRGRDGGRGPGRRAGGAAGRGCVRPRRAVGDPAGDGDFGLDPETTDSGALEDVLSALSGAFGRARARDAVLAGFAEQDVATLYLGSSTGRAPLARAADGGGEPGRAHGGRERFGLGRRAHHRALARATWNRRSGADSTGPPRRSRSTPAATR